MRFNTGASLFKVEFLTSIPLIPSPRVMSAVGFGKGGSKECITMERGLNAQESCLSVCPLNRATQRLNYSFKPRRTKGKELDSTPAFVVKHLET